MKLLISLFIFFSSIYALEELGTYGATHTIKEENFMDVVEEKAKDLNSTLLIEQLKNSKNKYLQVNSLIPTCENTRTREFVPTFVVPADVILPNGKVIARAGTVMNTLDIMKKNHITIDRYMMFIDVDDSVQVQLSYMYKNQGNVFVVNGSIDEYESKTRVPTFKADKQILEKFNVTCSPSLVIQKGNKLVIYEYNPKEIMKGSE